MALAAFRTVSSRLSRHSLMACSMFSDRCLSKPVPLLASSCCCNLPVRSLYSEEHLGLPGFRRQRVAAAERFGPALKEQYLERLRASLAKQPTDPVFSDDIKTVISLAESKDDVDLLIELLRRYLRQNNELVPDFRFGPLLMRVLMITGQVDLALSLYRDSDLKPLFAQFTSTWLLLDMLYEDARCLDALAVYDDFCKLTQEKTIPPACTTLALACCYKMNSEESFGRCLEILKTAQTRGSTIGSRGVCYAAMLSLKLHKPAVCLEILGLRPRSLRPTPINNLRAMALAEMGRIEDAIHILRFASHQDEPKSAKPLSFRTRRPTIFPDTIDRINGAAFKLNDKAIMSRIRSIENALRDGGHVIAGQRFEDFLAMSVRAPRRASTSSSSYSSSNSYGTGRFPSSSRFSSRQRQQTSGGSDDDDEEMLDMPLEGDDRPSKGDHHHSGGDEAAAAARATKR